MSMDKALIDELSQVKKSEKLILVEALWDSIASDPSEVEVPEHHKAIIEERLKTLEKDKKTGSSREKIRHPFHHQVVQNENVRRALVNRFPFSIYFEIE